MVLDVSALDAESAAWLRDLAGPAQARDDAQARLYGVLLRAAHSQVRRRGTQLRVSGPELDDIATQAAGDALVAITGKLGQFRGESRFTTWAYAFVVFEVSRKIGRHFWRRPDAALDSADWERLPDRFGFDPARESEWRDLAAAVRRAVDEVLTPRQRQVFVALVLDEVPLDALADRLGTNRNAVYKALFDARRKLRATLTAEGFLPERGAA